MRTVFFTWITDDFKDTIVDFQGFYRSFKYFHPDVDLKVYTDAEVKQVFGSESWIMHSTCKAAFAKKLYDQYDLVVNVDADFYFFDRCHEILTADYDVAASSNFNIVCNSEIKEQIIDGVYIQRVNFLHYIQGGLVASTNKNFWDDYYDLTGKIGLKMPLYENDILNILWYSGKYKTKILDGDYYCNSANFNCYYNCASLGKEHYFELVNNQVVLDGLPVRSYHVAMGNNGANGYRKKRYRELFNRQICNWFDKIT